MSIAATIAVSGMNAASLRLATSARNVANALSGGPLPDAPGYAAKFDPAAAGIPGLVANPAVDLASEILQQLMGRFALTANAQVLRADAQMTGTLLDIMV